ncbi:hypothetical protein FFWV33_11020 [Flavobacterium faecale]|uniref:Uncharacterized protein n=1 Tax=Flavobacterium faecale TaxID=1355330 RepID=A0A2S1LE56_9FLAO|nr:hypothetical protein FFWV33_11020 [Flavobacterium faecale]
MFGLNNNYSFLIFFALVLQLLSSSGLTNPKNHIYKLLSNSYPWILTAIVCNCIVPNHLKFVSQRNKSTLK